MTPATRSVLTPAMTPVASEALDPRLFPLRGSRLIEASAGTGKTYTIAALYVRLVLGPLDEQDALSYPRPLNPPEILVVTFTEAATHELRDRIRSRLAEAAGMFLTGATPDDAFLRDLRDAYPVQAWPACARKLQSAAEWMDESAVSTIHSWCNRMLREHAFDSGALFVQTLDPDQDALLEEVVRDYWRMFLAPLAPDLARTVATWFKGPAALQATLKRLLPHAGRMPGSPEPAVALAQARADGERILAALKAPWTAWVPELQALLDEAHATGSFQRRSLSQANYTRWLKALAAWAEDPLALRPGLSDAARNRLSVAGLAEVWESSTSPSHPALTALAELYGHIDALPDGRVALLQHATGWVTERLAAEQARLARLGFSDMLTQLEAALRGPQGPRLANRIRAQFPVVMIDEFQDTDPVQYRIFDAIYRVAEDDPDVGLVLIGDPKQAIYAFRGADIHTYLAARRACGERRHSLRTNYRSSAAMVAAVNGCFSRAEAPGDSGAGAGQGAFLFRVGPDNPVPFLEAEAVNRVGEFRIGTTVPAALTAWALALPESGKAMTKTAYLEVMAEVCASEIVRLLHLGQTGEAVLVTDLGLSRALHPGDMAILVNSGDEAAAVRAALARRRVRSVYVSDRESVFLSPVAGELEYWLAACAAPEDGRRIRAALATPLLGLSWHALDRLLVDDPTWEREVARFQNYREVWRRQGVLPMVRHMMRDFRVAERLLRGPGAEREGERTLTDLLHLAELLQRESSRREGEHGLIRYLAEQRQDANPPAGSEDARQRRLESDADLIQVVTVHKAKGLEYPLVFMPYAANYRAVSDKSLPWVLHDRDGTARVVLEASDQAREQADQERLGEDVRKLYVALTRARYATWIGVAPLEGIHRSALGYLLSSGESIPPEGVAAALDSLARDCPGIRVIHAPEASADVFRPASRAQRPGLARVPLRAPAEHWWIASYSALTAVHAGSGGWRASPDSAREDIFRETLAEPSPGSPGQAQAEVARGLHDFPRGAEAGTFLHELLEWCAETGFRAVLADPAGLHGVLARLCETRGWMSWLAPLEQWLQDFLSMEFVELQASPERRPGLVLAELDTWAAELEFWIGVSQVDVPYLDQLVCRHTLAAQARPALAPQVLNGMLKGFMDLVFEWQGRYYVADYKSNWLGLDAEAYTPEAMRSALLEHRYDLQYALYLLALHRLLKLRIPDYDYDVHMGGAVYFFLRGAQAPSQGLHFERPPRVLIETLDRLFSDGAEGAASLLPPEEGIPS